MPNNLKVILANRKMSMHDLARLTGLSVSMISRMCAGTSLKLFPWYKVMTVLDVDWEDMFPDFYGMEDISDEG